MASEGLITIAYGPETYIRMARALALSYKRHRPGRPIAVVTDEMNRAALQRHFDIVIPINPAYGKGVIQKLHVDLYSPFEKTLFVDSDCLFYKDPNLVWDVYHHGPFCMRGWRYLTGESDYEKSHPYEWVANTRDFLQLNKISRLAHFNSGLFYFDHSAEASHLFQVVRSIYERREALGFVPFKGAPIADEPALATAMELCGIDMYPWDSTNGMETAISMQNGGYINVLTGASTFTKSGVERHPAVIHFNMDGQSSFIYTRDVCRLFTENFGFQPLLANVFLWPRLLGIFAKRAIRRLSRVRTELLLRTPAS